MYCVQVGKINVANNRKFFAVVFLHTHTRTHLRLVRAKEHVNNNGIFLFNFHETITASVDVHV